MVKDYFTSSRTSDELIEISRQLIDDGDFDDAIFILTSVINDPLSACLHEEAYRLRGGAYLDSRRWHRSIEDQSNALILNESSANSYNERGLAYRSINEHEKAFQDFAEAIRLNPDSTTYRTNRAVSYMAKGLYDECITDIFAALAIEHTDVNGLHLLAKVDYEIGDYSNGILGLSKLIALHEERRTLYLDRALIYVELCEWEKARKDFVQARKLASRLPPVQQRGAYHKISDMIEGCALLFVDGNRFAALEVLRHSFGNPVHESNLHYICALACVLLGRDLEAMVHLKEALSKKPQLAPCLRSLALLKGDTSYLDDKGPVAQFLRKRNFQQGKK